MQSTEFVEPGAVEGIKAWFAQTSRPAFAFAPLHPKGEHAVQQEKKQATNADEIESFLSKIFDARGELSMVYVSISVVSCASQR